MPGRMSREEWNAAYFLGLKAVIREERPLTLVGQLRLGMDLLARAGHEFAAGEFEPAQGGAHEGACRELALGSFDGARRAREALCWLRVRAPSAERGWIERVVRQHEELHSGTDTGARAV